MNEWWGYGWQDARQGWVEWGGAWQKYCRASCLMIFSFGWLFCSLFLFWSLLGVRPLPCKRLTLEKLVAWGTSPPRSSCKAIVYLWRRYHRNPGTVVLFPVATFSCQRRTPSPPSLLAQQLKAWTARLLGAATADLPLPVWLDFVGKTVLLLL